MMHALSLWRPWPWCFWFAGKGVENRSWAMPRTYHGRQLIMHGSKKFDEQAHLHMREGRFGEAAQAVPRTEHATGAVGAFTLLGSLPIGEFLERYGDHPAAHFAFGPHVWLASEAILLPRPVPFGGRQGIFQLTGDEERAVRAELLAATHRVTWEWPGFQP